MGERVEVEVEGAREEGLRPGEREYAQMGLVKGGG